MFLIQFQRSTLSPHLYGERIVTSAVVPGSTFCDDTPFEFIYHAVVHICTFRQPQLLQTGTAPNSYYLPAESIAACPGRHPQHQQQHERAANARKTDALSAHRFSAATPPLLYLCTLLLRSFFQRLIETNSIRLIPRSAITAPEIPQIMHRHPRANHQHALLTQWCKSFPQCLMLRGIFRVEKRDLHHGHVQRVFLRVESH
jgi:hypothetical protein